MEKTKEKKTMDVKIEVDRVAMFLGDKDTRYEGYFMFKGLKYRTNSIRRNYKNAAEDATNSFNTFALTNNIA